MELNVTAVSMGLMNTTQIILATENGIIFVVMW